MSGFRAETFGQDLATSLPTNVISGAVINTKGAWTEMAAATSFDADLIFVNVVTANTTGPCLIDVGIGGAGSEVVLIPDVVLDNGDGGMNNMNVPYPVSIPAGSRIALRNQGKTVDKRHRCSVTLVGHGFGQRAPFAGVTACGILSAGDTGHAKLTPHSTAHTKGAWVELHAALPLACREVILFFGRANLTRSTNSYLIDIGIGGAGSEVVVLPNVRAESNNLTNQVLPIYIGPFPFEIPAGTRVAARAQGGLSSSQLIGCSLHAIG